MKKHVTLLSSLSAAFLLAACGDNVEEVTQINQMGMEIVADEDDLPKCTDENEGEQALVKGETTIRVCMEDEWTAMKDDFSCKTVELKDKSGYKIVCNGDSIGVVLNGSDGKDGKDGEDGEDAEVAKPDTSVNDSEKVAISLDSLVGVTQKGPFLKGSTVYLYELSDGRTLKQTNGNFTSNIASENGRYKFMARDLVSQYAMVVVDGYYRNEVTGVTSDAPIRLKAITDMRKRSSVNVNILTQLEYDRVYYLVTRGDKDGNKLTVKQAKRQAQKEILKLFDIELDDDTDAEDMDVFGKTDADAALLAISVLLQGDTSATDLSVILTEISNALAEKGEWNDSAAKARFADWALKADTENRLAQFRKNVADWHLGDTVPGFEKFVRNYINVVTGLGICGDKKNPVGTFAHVPNKKSGYYAKAYDSIDATKNSLARVVCDDKGGKHWRIATDLERDTKGWEKDSAGTVRKGQIDTSLTYVYEDGWRHGTDLDRVVGFGCIKAFKDAVAKVTDTSWYACAVSTDENSAWYLLSNREKDSVSLKAYNDKDSIPGLLLDAPFTKKTLVWDADTLREANDYEILLKKACVTSMYGYREKLPNTLTYVCRNTGWSKTGTFEHRWGNLNYQMTIYAGVQIGSQVWMAENLNYDYPHKTYCYGDCSRYGELYTWSDAMDSLGKFSEEGVGCGLRTRTEYDDDGRYEDFYETTCWVKGPVRGICPEGWHLPSLAEWRTLIDYVGGESRAGLFLKSETEWMYNGTGSDYFAFSALPAGEKDYDGQSVSGRTANFWTSTVERSGACYITLSYDSDKAIIGIEWDHDDPIVGKDYSARGMSVRCVHD